MLFPLSLAEAASGIETASQSSEPISVQTALLIVIAAALVFLAILHSKLHRRINKVEADSETSSRAPFAQNANATTDAIPPEVVAAISAAVHTTLGSNHRILALGQPCPHRQAWSLEGRRQVFDSHRVR